MSPMTHVRMIFPAARLPASFSTILTLLAAISVTLRTWQTRARQRRELRNLDEAVLRDVGISRAQAHFTADKPFWRE